MLCLAVILIYPRNRENTPGKNLISMAPCGTPIAAEAAISAKQSMSGAEQNNSTHQTFHIPFRPSRPTMISTKITPPDQRRSDKSYTPIIRDGGIEPRAGKTLTEGCGGLGPY